ncbi:MAG: GAF domain-containing protein [Phototrophicaceae bacterium]
MSRNVINKAILLLIVILTLISLVISVQAITVDAIITRIPELVVYALVTAFALILSVPLVRSELSVAHAIGLMALLSLPADVAPAMTIALFIGGALGGVVRARIEQNSRRYESPAWYATTLHTSARVTVAYFVASFLYINVLNAPLPISDMLDVSPQLSPLIITITVYLVLYFISFMVQVRMYTRLRQVLADNWVSLLIILILPVPFALLGASVAQIDNSILFFGITIVGAVLIIFGLFALNQTQQQLQRQLDEIRSISVATRAMRGNLELDGLLRTTYVQVSQLLDTINFTVVLYNDIEMRMIFPLVIRDGNEVNITEAQGLPADYPLIDHMMQMTQPLLIENDVPERLEQLGLRPISKPLTSWLGVPLVIAEKPIGAFVVQSYDKRRFDADDLRVMNIVVASTGIAIENARLYSQKSVRAEQLATLNQVTSLLTGTLAPNEVLDIVVSSASAIAESDAVSVYIFEDSDTHKITLARSIGLSDAFTFKPPMPILEIPMTRLDIDQYKTPESLLIENLDSTDVSGVRQRLIDEKKRAFIEHPLVFGGKNLGILVLYFNKPQRYHPEQIDMIQAFATQAAQAINNAQRFETADRALEQRVEQLYALSAMGRIINATVEINKIYDVVLSYASDATKAPRGFVALFNSNGRLFVPSQRGYDATLFDDAEFLQQGLSGRVLQTGQPLRIGDTRRETGYLPFVPQTRSMLITPIMKGKRVLGLILLENNQANAFSEGDGHFVAQIANQAVIAADNTQLFQRIRQARDNMKVILDAMQEGIILIDDTGHVIQTNPRINIIEISPNDIIDQTIDDLLNQESLKFAQHLGFSTPQAVQNITANLNKEWESYPPHDYEIHDDEFGVRYIQRQIIPVRDEDRHISGIMLVFYNKSEEHELEVARESLSQMIVHDLRSPLTSVTTSLGLLQRLVPKDTEFAEIVEQTTSMSRHAIRKVLARVDSLLDISKMESGEIRLDREPSHIRHIVESVESALNPLAKEHQVTIKTSYDPTLPLVSIDADKVERMILNLIDNAIKYSPPDSDVSVRVIYPEPEFIRIEIADSGPGIPDDYKKRLFDRYVQIEGRKTVRRGVGLGLTFCKLVTEAHQGDIWVADNPLGKGSVFKVTLPIADPKKSSMLTK